MTMFSSTPTAAMMLLAQANDLISLFIALETTSIAQFIMVGIGRRDRCIVLAEKAMTELMRHRQRP